LKDDHVKGETPGVKHKRILSSQLSYLLAIPPALFNFQLVKNKVTKLLKNTLAVLDAKEKRQFSILVMLDLIISIVDILSLVLLLWIIQFYIRPEQGHQTSFLPQWLADKDSVVLIAIFFFLFSLKNIAGYFISKAHYTFISRVAVRLSHNNLAEYQGSVYNEYVGTDSSVHIRKIAFQPFEFCQYILSGIPQIITQSFLILLTAFAILLFNAKLFLLVLAILLPPVVFIFYFIKKRLNKIKNQIITGNENSVRYLLDALKGYVESNVYGRNDFFLQRFVNARKRFSASLFESISVQQMPSRNHRDICRAGIVCIDRNCQMVGEQQYRLPGHYWRFYSCSLQNNPGYRTHH
jgi:ABC-type multidrug transport system fused ATPase/permease subunit